MSDLLLIDEMHTRFPSEWLLILNPETDEGEELIRGTVVFHSKDRDEVYRKAIELHPEDFAFHCTGTIPKDAAVVL